ncbi:MAG TPA: DUF4282 domain-containing protein [Gammaproteobacteria bacterium]
MFNIRDIFFFDELLTPKVITLLYWLALLYVAVSGLSVMFAGDKMTFARFTSGLGVMLGGVVAARIGSELLVVAFKINENLQTLANRKE